MDKEIKKMKDHISKLELENVILKERLGSAISQIEAYGLSEEAAEDILDKDELKEHNKELAFIVGDVNQWIMK